MWRNSILYFLYLVDCGSIIEAMKDELRRNHKKKMIAPVIITVIFLLYLIVYLIAVAMTTRLSPGMLLLSIPLVALGIGMVYTLKARIDEIRSGEEDDLSDY